MSARDAGGIGALHDTARQAARDERDRLGAAVSDYVCGRITEAVLAVVEHRCLEAEADPIDVDSDEVGRMPPVEPLQSFDPWVRLHEIVWPALVAGAAFVDVPARALHAVGYTDHPGRWPWIPGIDDRPRSCGEFIQLEHFLAERWCLLDEDHDGPHDGPHGWEGGVR